MGSPYSNDWSFSLVGRRRARLARFGPCIVLAKTSKLADWRTGYALVIGCKTCKHARRTDPHSLARVLGWDVPLIVVTARLRCSNCYAKDCEIQVDRLVAPRQRSVPKRLL